MADTAAAPFPNSNISSLHNRIALITGGSSGIGRHIAVAYAAAGAYIVIADLTPNPPKVPLLEQTSAARHTDHHTPILEILNTKWPVPSDSKHKDRAAFVKCDVTVPEDVEAAVAFAVSTFGRLDIYVNNAGVGLETSVTPVKPLHETDVGLFDKTMAINVRGVWLGMKYAIGQMMRQEVLGGEDGTGDRGWIINMSSVYGLVGSSHVSSYAGSKGAVTLMTRAAAVEYAPYKIHINSIHPGYCDTPFLEAARAQYGVGIDESWKALHPWGRLTWPEDVAKMAVFCAGNGVSFVTGHQFVVDGGFTAR